MLRIDGASLTLADGQVANTANMSASVAMSGSTATVTIDKLGVTTPAAMQSLIDAMAYSNTDESPTAGNRAITITELRDTGATGGLDDNTGAPNIVSTITVVPTNDAPVADDETFDLATLAAPVAAVGLIEAGQDQWLLPRFHIERVRAACARCELLANLPAAGHGSLFSPWPDSLARSLTPLLVDPPGFDRAGLPAVYATLTGFFVRTVVMQR